LRVKVASVTYLILPPYGEKGQHPGKKGQERGLRWERRKGVVEGGKA
jgi:hypothetical protein